MAGIDDEVVVVIDDSSSALNRKEPVELTPLELCTLRNELVLLRSLLFMADELVFLIGSLFHDMRLMMTADGIDFIDDGFVDADDADDGSLPCVLVPSAVKYRPKFL